MVALGLWRAAGEGPDSSTPPPSTEPVEPVPDSSPAPTSFISDDELSGLRIAVSVADLRRATRGQLRSERDGPKPTDVFTYEEPPTVQEGRFLVHAPGGWVDRSRTPLARSNAFDLAARTPPINAIATDDAGNGWVAGGSGSMNDLFNGRVAEVPELFLAPLGTPPFDVRPADERPLEARAARQAVDLLPTSLPSTPSPTSTTPDPDLPLPAPSGPGIARVLVGGHPACLSECAGRGDQGLAPDATLEDALITAEKVAAPGEQGAPPSLMVLGGGRSTKRGGGLTRAGAQRYLDLLQAHPTVPAVLAIGTGDASTDDSRANFADAARTLLRERTATGSALTLPTTPTAPIERPESTTVAYALDAATADGGRARIVVIDNAGGRLNGGVDGAQSRWLFQVLDEAERNGWQTVVVGAARLDGAGGVQAEDREDELAILGRGGADAYIATDGVDDPADAYFGDQSVRYPTDRAHGAPIGMYRTAALGHQRRSGIFADFAEDRPDVPDANTGWGGPAILDVGLGGPNPKPDVSCSRY